VLVLEPMLGRPPKLGPGSFLPFLDGLPQCLHTRLGCRPNKAKCAGGGRTVAGGGFVRNLGSTVTPTTVLSWIYLEPGINFTSQDRPVMDSSGIWDHLEFPGLPVLDSSRIWDQFKLPGYLRHGFIRNLGST